MQIHAQKNNHKKLFNNPYGCDAEVEALHAIDQRSVKCERQSTKTSNGFALGDIIT